MVSEHGRSSHSFFVFFYRQSYCIASASSYCIASASWSVFFCRQGYCTSVFAVIASAFLYPWFLLLFFLLFCIKSLSFLLCLTVSSWTPIQMPHPWFFFPISPTWSLSNWIKQITCCGNFRLPQLSKPTSCLMWLMAPIHVQKCTTETPMVIPFWILISLNGIPKIKLWSPCLCYLISFSTCSCYWSEISQGSLGYFGKEVHIPLKIQCS